MNKLAIFQMLIYPLDSRCLHVRNSSLWGVELQHRPFNVDHFAERMAFVDCVISVVFSILKNVWIYLCDIAAVFDGWHVYHISDVIEKTLYHEA